MSRFSTVAVALVLALAGLSSAFAQAEYPNRPIKIVVPVAPGGLADMLGRAVGQQLGLALKQQVFIENKPGGNFQIGIKEVLGASADGYTLLVAQEGAIVLNPHLYSTLSYDPLKELSPISGIAKVDQVLIVHPSVPAKDGKELIAYAKSKTGELSFGTFGPGSTPQLYMEMLHHMAGLKFIPVTYRGAAPMLSDVVANHVPMTFISLGQALPLHKEGKVRIIAVCTAQRLDVLPDVPTLAESGIPGFEATAWHGLFAKAGTPPEILSRINAEIQRMSKDPEFKAKVLDPTFFRSMASSQPEFESTIKAETTKWKTFVEAAKLRID
ncbi:MAG: tripartite tricarboxylate transporter substrate binding protein [Hyphomicrobiales bacterium]|nr:tripartite tricarboxylate transporter substrate binding protein [Alphaproteobacteria bacterium]